MTKRLFISVAGFVLCLSAAGVTAWRSFPSASPPQSASLQLLEASEPVDDHFSGCQSACGSRSEADRARARPQPGVAPGIVTYCPVSGAVFEVSASRPSRTVDGLTLYFCCDACAAYFDEHKAEVLARRGIHPAS
jgi:hypothetical protein